ncbi:MAG: hypothetical protein ACK5WZ_14915 [Pseudobdellovibrionaceae bacterium]
MENLEWIRDLAITEKKLEENGLFDSSTAFDLDRILTQASVDFMLHIRQRFNDIIDQFNDLKISSEGRIKTFQVANTHLDFMLIRHSYKMVFTQKEPGRISIKFNFSAGQYIPFQNPLGIKANLETKTSADMMSEHTIMAKWGAFHEVIWTFREQPINLENLVRYYISYFIRESLK